MDKSNINYVGPFFLKIILYCNLTLIFHVVLFSFMIYFPAYVNCCIGKCKINVPEFKLHVHLCFLPNPHQIFIEFSTYIRYNRTSLRLLMALFLNNKREYQVLLSVLFRLLVQLQFLPISYSIC